MANEAGWQPDPSGRHQYRYWDGSQWTDQVADNGVAGTDPLTSAEAPTVVSPPVTSDPTPVWTRPESASAAPTPSTAWSKFRAWPIWAQILLWVFVWPVPLVLLALGKPSSDRPKFVVLAVVGVLLWVGIGVASSLADSDDTPTASRSATTDDVATTTAKPTATTKPKTTTTRAPATTTTPPSPPPSTDPPPTAPPPPVETVSQKNARRKAADYLEFMAFSRKGLIEQLKFEGFSEADATYGVDALNVDWNEQAAKKAADYLDFSSFSRKGLIDQLIFEGFTRAQAEYGVSTTGL